MCLDCNTKKGNTVLTGRPASILIGVDTGRALSVRTFIRLVRCKNVLFRQFNGRPRQQKSEQK